MLALSFSSALQVKRKAKALKDKILEDTSVGQNVVFQQVWWWPWMVWGVCLSSPMDLIDGKCF